MFIKTEIVKELPNANRGFAKVTYTQEQADTFYRELILAQGSWVKYFEASVKPEEIANTRLSRHTSATYAITGSMAKASRIKWPRMAGLYELRRWPARLC